MDTKQCKKEKCWADYKAQQLYIDAMREAKEDPEFDPRRTHLVIGKDGQYKKLSQSVKVVPKNPLTVQYLCFAYDIPYPTFKRWKADAFQTAEKHVPHKGKTVLTSLTLATQVFNPRRMYVDHHMAQWLIKNPHRKYDPVAKKQQKQFYRKKWDDVPATEKEPYEKASRDHLGKQKVMQEAVTHALQKDKGGNCSRSYASVAKSTGDWCSSQTIFNWLKSQPDFCMYTKRIRPGLTEANRLKQIEFSKHVHATWGLAGIRKILWTMSDEKWWFGLVSRTFAKMCPALGIKKEVFAVHHKKHIAKVNLLHQNPNLNPYPTTNPNRYCNPSIR